MKRPICRVGLSGILLALASGGLAASAHAQVPPTARAEQVTDPLAQVVGGGLAAPAGGVVSARPEDEKAIRQLAATFTQAFNAGDAKTVAGLYNDDAELINEYDERLDGRSAIQDFYAALFSERKGATIDISMSSLRFLGPGVAKEHGQTRVRPGGGEPATYRDYTVLYVKQGGRWLYSCVREEHPTGLVHNERLKELEWLVGEWLDESSDSVIQETCRWSEDKNFLLRDFVIHIEGKPVMNVTQRIGWDPLSKQIKSWVFDSDGGYGDALWTREGNQWIIKSSGVLPDGRIATATNLLTRTGLNSARWASTQRTTGGQAITNHHESVMVRKPPRPQTELRPR
jgi:uncharacterized protein (TIGR02246 family)